MKKEPVIILAIVQIIIVLGLKFGVDIPEESALPVAAGIVAVFAFLTRRFVSPAVSE